MRKYILLLMVFFFTYSITSIAQIGKKPIAHYTFDGDANDSSGNHNNGRIYNNVSVCADRQGNACGAMEFDGASYIEIPNSPSLSQIATNFSVTGWINFSSYCNNSLFWATILCKGDGLTETDNNPQFRLQFTKVTFSVKSNMVGDRGVVSWDMASEFSYDTWHFFATTYDGLELKMYLDGREIFNDYISLYFTNNTSPLHIGRDIPGQDEYFCGKLDDIQIFDKKLSSKDVKKIFNHYPQTPPCPNTNPVNVPKPVIPVPDDCDFPESMSGNTIQYAYKEYETKRSKMMVFSFDKIDTKNKIYININGNWMPDPIQLTENRVYILEHFLDQRCNYILFKSAKNFAVFDIEIDRTPFGNIECSETVYYGIKIIYDQ